MAKGNDARDQALMRMLMGVPVGKQRKRRADGSVYTKPSRAQRKQKNRKK